MPDKTVLRLFPRRGAGGQVYQASVPVLVCACGHTLDFEHVTYEDDVAHQVGCSVCACQQFQTVQVPV